MGFHIFMQDISARKAIEMHNRMLSKIIENTNDMVVVTEANDIPSQSNIIYINPSFERKTAYPPQDIIHKKSLSSFLSKQHREKLDSHSSKNDSSLGEFILNCNKNNTFWCDINLVNIENNPGKHDHFAWILRDTSKEKSDQKQLNKTLEDLKRSNNELEKFAYIASHDLKSPLRAIDTISGWLEEDLESSMDDNNKDNIKKLRGRIHRMEKLLDDLLEYSRIGHDKKTFETINLSDMINDIIKTLSIPKSFSITTSSDMDNISLPKMPLQQVFHNLINNAVKHHDKDRGKIEIIVKQEKNFYQFSVIDNGPGIDEKYYLKIFEMFQTLKPRDEVEGSGMGLSMVKKIVHNKGGTIHVESVLKEGSQFIFTWPINH